MGEDIEFSIRIHNLGFKIGLIETAKVYHKRRTSLPQFYKQLHFFGRARINIFRFYKSELKLVHTFPFLFTAALVIWLTTFFVFKPLFLLGTFLLTLYILLLFIDCLLQTKSLLISVLGVSAAFTQLIAYGVGFFTEGLRYFKQPQPVGLRKSSHL
jgi:GT2 family glycosyltransferase